MVSFGLVTVMLVAFAFMVCAAAYLVLKGLEKKEKQLQKQRENGIDTN